MGPGNVMRSGPDVKIIDFGLASLLKNNYFTEKCGTAEYMAPEVFDGRYGKEADIWAVGVMLHYLLVKSFPFDSVCDKIETAVKTMELSFPECWNRRFLRRARDLIRGMLVKNPQTRLTAAECLRSEWIKRRAPKRSG